MQFSNSIFRFAFVNHSVAFSLEVGSDAIVLPKSSDYRHDAAYVCCGLLFGNSPRPTPRTTIFRAFEGGRFQSEGTMWQEYFDDKPNYRFQNRDVDKDYIYVFVAVV